MMKKKIIAMMMAGIMASVVLVGCGRGSGESAQSAGSSVTESVQESQPEPEQEPEGKITEEELGSRVRVNVWYAEDAPGEEYYINLPGYYNYNQPRGCWEVSASLESDNYILMAGQRKHFEPVNSVVEVFPAYCVYIPEQSGRFQTTIKEILETESVEVNGIGMCKYKGTCESYNNDKELVQEKFVAYAAPISEGGYGFWVAIGTGDEASIEADADFVAKTFRETEEFVQ